MSEKGYVYVLTNPSFRDDWVKIGKSKRLPEVRGRELYNTAVPLPYEIYATLQTEKYNEAERMIHRSIDRISDLRINKNREFFNIAPESAYEILADIKELLGEEAVIELKGELEGTKTLTKIEMMITGDFSGFTMSLDEEQSGGFPVLMKLTMKLNKLGFTLDFNADPLTLPSDTELEGFELVEYPPFAGIMDGLM